MREASTEEPEGFGSDGELSRIVMRVEVKVGLERRESAVERPKTPAPIMRICCGGEELDIVYMMSMDGQAKRFSKLTGNFCIDIGDGLWSKLVRQRTLFSAKRDAPFGAFAVKKD